MKKRPSSGIWPPSQWKRLLRTAIRVLDAIPFDRWCFGGGSAIAMRLGHRISYDADIFLLDPQVLGHLSPDTNDLVAGFAKESVRSASGMKIVTGGGDIDFVVAPDVTADLPVDERIDGRTVATHTNAEILAKKVQYRGFKFTHRDVFDLAVLIDRERASVDRALASCDMREVDAAFDICIGRLPGLAGDLPHYVNPTRAGERYIREAGPIVADFIAAYRKLKPPRARG